MVVSLYYILYICSISSGIFRNWCLWIVGINIFHQRRPGTVWTPTRTRMGLSSQFWRFSGERIWNNSSIEISRLYKGHSDTSAWFLWQSSSPTVTLCFRTAWLAASRTFCLMTPDVSGLKSKFGIWTIRMVFEETKIAYSEVSSTWSSRMFPPLSGPFEWQLHIAIRQMPEASAQMMTMTTMMTMTIIMQWGWGIPW